MQNIKKDAFEGYFDAVLDFGDSLYQFKMAYLDEGHLEIRHYAVRDFTKKYPLKSFEAQIHVVPFLLEGEKKDRILSFPFKGVNYEFSFSHKVNAGDFKFLE